MSVPDSELLAQGASVPSRAIGEVSLVALAEHVVYPQQWPPQVVAAMKRRGPGKPIRCYADGIFDMFHYGHARALEQAKKSFPNVHLLVGVCNDALTHSMKGKTVMNEKERYEAVAHCRWADEVVTDAPWSVDDAFLAKHDIDFVCHDALPYPDASAGGAGDVYQPLREKGKFWATNRTDGISTTDLILRIISQYEEFVRRNLSRGVSASEMHVPSAVRMKIALKDQMDSISALFGGGIGSIIGVLGSLGMGLAGTRGTAGGSSSSSAQAQAGSAVPPAGGGASMTASEEGPGKGAGSGESTARRNKRRRDK